MTAARMASGDVIGKISIPRGEHIEPLLYYLFGPGRHEEHTDPHIVAGWHHPVSLEPALRPDGKRDFATLTGLLKQPQAALGERGYPRPVWHCSMRAAPGDRMQPHDDFRRIFITEAIMNGMPPHIAQLIAGHKDINATMGYKAVYPEEAIQAHRAFIARRRALRPPRNTAPLPMRNGTNSSALRAPQGRTRRLRPRLRNPLSPRARLLNRNDLEGVRSA